MRVNEDLDLLGFINILQSLREVSARLVMTRSEEGWTAQMMMLSVAPDLPPAKWSVYDYGRIAFIAGVLPGTEIAKWLQNTSGRLAGYDFKAVELDERVGFDRFPSHARYRWWNGLWQPHSLYQLNAKLARFEPRERVPLIRDGCPSFPTVVTAVYKLLYQHDTSSDSNMPSHAVSLRVAHTEAWIEQVEQQPSSVSVDVRGDDVEGVRIEITGPGDIRFDEKLSGPKVVRFDLPRGMPERLWVLLSRGERWLDLRDLHAHGSRSAWDNVIDVPPDVQVQVAGAIARGEGERTEFKEQLPYGEDKFLKVVAAFANGEGGMIILGVADDTGEIKGLSSDLNVQRDRISQMIRDRIIPEPKVRIERCEIDARALLVIIVSEGEKKPYGVGSDPKKLQYYVRRGATTPPARQDEIRAMVSKHGSDSPASFEY